jgi:hypothetical protein
LRRHVHSHGKHAICLFGTFGDGVFDRIGVDIGKDDTTASRQEAIRDSKTDASGASGDYSDAAIDPLHAPT